jgi:hypothetical protein
MLGQRQALQYGSVATGSSRTVQVDNGPFRISRIKLLPPNGALAQNATIRIQAEGEQLFGGNSVPLALVAVRTDDVTAPSTNTFSPYVIAFDRPLELSQAYPITIWWDHGSGSSGALQFVLEGA